MELNERMERFRSYLGDQGLRFTQQRRAIAEAFFSQTSDHLTITEVLELARARHASVGYATVYRTLKLLTDSGLASEHKFSDHALYEPSHDGEHHDHIICTTCGHIVEFESHEIERLQDEIVARLGFRVTNHRHEIYAECTRENCPNLALAGGADRA